MGSWIKRSTTNYKGYRATRTQRFGAGKTSGLTSTSYGNGNGRLTYTYLPDGRVRKTRTEHLNGMTKRTVETERKISGSKKLQKYKPRRTRSSKAYTKNDAVVAKFLFTTVTGLTLVGVFVLHVLFIIFMNH